MEDRTIPPRLLVALALVGAAGLVMLAAMVTMVTVSSSHLGIAAHVGLLDRIRLGTRLVDLPVLALLPLAVLMARLVEPGGRPAPLAATRAVLAGSAALGAALAFLVLLRVMADLSGQELFVDSRPRLATLLANLASLLVAVAGAAWALRELQRTPRTVPAAPPPLPPPPRSSPPSSPAGFPAGPPPDGPPPGPAPDWGRAQDRQ